VTFLVRAIKSFGVEQSRRGARSGFHGGFFDGDSSAMDEW
jgi:hypothetical protein